MTWYYIKNSAEEYLTDLDDDELGYFYTEEYECATLFATRKAADILAEKHNGTVHKVIITFEKEED